VSHLPGDAADAARESIAGALAIAARLGDDTLAANAKAAYLDGMTLVLITCAAIATAGAALAAALMPGRAPQPAPAERR
jgi:hypothetical protein